LVPILVLVLGLGLGLVCGWGCGGNLAPEAIPYAFRQSLIEPGPSGVAEAEQAPRAPHRKPRSAARCRKLVGRTFRTSAGMLRACLGGPVPVKAIKGGALELDRRLPRPMDLVLFHNTRDDNGNGKLDDRFTEAGVVLALEGQRVTFIYLRRGRARRGFLNLTAPHRRRLVRRGPIENTYLRVKRPDDPRRTMYLAGQLLAGFTSVAGRL
jgi:hypothetical protein